MIARLKEEVLAKYGSPLNYTKDCKILADDVFHKTGEMLSNTTIRRLFGFLKTMSSPSRYTLNVLSRYVGTNSWDDFIDKLDKEVYLGEEFQRQWDSLYERSLQLSRYTYNLIKEKSGIDFDSVVCRDFAQLRIDRFLKSDYMALSFVAPGGYGKSCMLAKWFEYNWLQKSGNDVVLFLNATFLINFLNSDFRLERWLHDQLGYANLNIFNHFLNNPQNCQGRIIIVMDALDEITYDILKLERLFIQLSSFIANYKQSKNVKLIVTSRNTTWEKFVNPLLSSGNMQKNVWFDLNLQYKNVDKTNMHPLNEKEVQSVFDTTINKQFKSNLLWEELGFRLKQTISYPYFLELFIKLYDPNTFNSLNEGLDLINEFLKNQVYYARFMEEKEDILMGILKLQDYGRNGNGAKKNDLKQLYPIHLKSVGNYYNAYEELLSFGIISEVLMDNCYGSYVKYVQIGHQFLFEMLVVSKMIDDNQGINFSLFRNIEREFDGFECRSRLIGIAYSMAYKERDFEALKDLFLLSDEVVSDSGLMSLVGRSFRDLDDFGKKLVRHYATQERAGIFLFENFVDLNYLMRSYRFVVEEFLAVSQSRRVSITCAAILLHVAVYSLHKKDAHRYYMFLLENEPDTLCSGYTVGVRLSGMMLYNHYISGESNELLLMKLFYYREMAYSSSWNYLKSGDGEFELVICNTLIQMKAFHKIEQLINDSEYFCESKKKGVLTGNFIGLLCYKMYARFELGLEVDDKQLEILEYRKNELSPSRGFIIHILYNLFMADYSAHLGDKSNTLTYIDKAIEISEYAQYDLITAGLMEKMSLFYSQWDDPGKEKICLDERDHILGSFKHIIKTEGILV